MGTKIFLGFFVSIFFLIFTSETYAIDGPLRVSTANPRYFTDNSGKAIYMTGSHTWDNLVDMISPTNPTAFNFTNYLNFLQANNHNFIRLWAWELTKSTYGSGVSYLQDITVSPHPWVRSGPGTALDGLPKFNLNQLNQTYFDRMRQRVIAAGARGIYASVMLFEGHGMRFSWGPWNWSGHPFHPSNNVNGIDGQHLKVHSLDNPAVTALQDAYVRKVIDTVNDLDNVLYEIANEDAGGTLAWQTHMISLIKSYEQNKPKKHPVGMTFRVAPESTNTELFNSNADWISPNEYGGYKDNPPAATGNKVIISDTDHLWGIGGNVDWVWKSFLRGLNPIFMDSMIVEIWSQGIIKAMGNTLTYANKMNLVSMTPQGNLSSTGYVLASVGNEYLVYQPGTGGFTVSLSSGTYTYEWFNVGTRSIAVTGQITASGSTAFTPPFSGPAVLYLKRTSLAQTPTLTATPTSPAPTGAGKPGDANGDNIVDGRDYIIWLLHYGQNVSGATNGDFDNNNTVDGRDYVVWLLNYGR